MPTFAVVSLGCPKNQVDTELLIERLRGAGLDFVENSFEADLVLINTCAFIGSAREEAIDTIWSYVGLKKEKPGTMLAVTGCLVQGFGPQVIEGFPEVDFWIRDPSDIEGVGRLVGSLAGTEPDIIDSGTPSRSILLGEPGSAYLKVAEGCDNRCSYCSIPLIKGGLRSRPLGEVERDAAALDSMGVHEVVLVAQDLTSYGRDLEDGTGLAVLLETLLEHSFDWIRLMYVYPGRLRPEVVRLMMNEPRICPYIDMPLQHSHPEVLAAMGRKGSGAEYLRIMEDLRSSIPGLVLRSTMLTGHPGEGPAEFDDLISFIEKARFEWMGVFPYSPEEGTASFALPGRPDETVARERAGEVEQLWRSVRRLDAFGIGEGKDALVIDATDDILICRSRTEAPEVDGVILARLDGPCDSRAGDRGNGEEGRDCDEGARNRTGVEIGSMVEVRVLDVDGLDFTATLTG